MFAHLKNCRVGVTYLTCSILGKILEMCHYNVFICSFLSCHGGVFFYLVLSSFLYFCSPFLFLKHLSKWHALGCKAIQGRLRLRFVLHVFEGVSLNRSGRRVVHSDHGLSYLYTYFWVYLWYIFFKHVIIGWLAGWMYGRVDDCNFTSFSTVFQSYQ